MTHPAPGGDSPRPAGASKALAVYNLFRLGLLAACLGLGYLAGLRGFALIVAALLVSGILSWFVLRAQRIRASVAVETAVNNSDRSQRALGPFKRRRDAMRAKVAAEDAYADEFRRRQSEEVTAKEHDSHDAREHGSHDVREHGSHDVREHGSHDVREHDAAR